MRKKIQEKSIRLFDKDNITGFQFTAGRTPLSVQNNDPFHFGITFNKNRQTYCFDSSEDKLKEKIFKTIFPDLGDQDYMGNPNGLTKVQIESLKIQFKELGYEIEEAMITGEWYWFRVPCTVDLIEHHVNILKDNIKL